MRSLRTVISLSLVVFGCGGAQGPEPHDMSVAQHEATADREEAAAGELAPRSGAVTPTECDPATICWSARQNPTADQVAAAKEHRERAAAHRAAAQKLRDAEGASCAGLSEADRDSSPFYYRQDIAWVKEIDKELRMGKTVLFRTVGARAFIRPVPGLTAEWLQRIVDCHIARAAAVGHDMPEMSYCPLVLREVTASVSSAGNGFIIEVQSNDPKVVEEIVRRMNALVAGR